MTKSMNAKIWRGRHWAGKWLSAVLAPLTVGLLIPSASAAAQTADPSDTDRTGASPSVRVRPAPRTRPQPKARGVTARRAPPRRITGLPQKTKPKKPKKSRPPSAEFYFGGDLTFGPGMATRRTVLGKGEELMPRTTAITKVHTTSLRYVQGFLLMNRVMDLRLAVGLANLQAAGSQKALWGSDFGLGVALHLYRRGRLALQLFNAYRLLIVTSPDDKVGFGLHFAIGVGASLRTGKRNQVEVRLGYCHQQLTFEEQTDTQVGGLETPAGAVLKTHMLLISFAFLHYH